MVSISKPKDLPKSFCFKPWNEVYSHFNTTGPCCVNYKLHKGGIDSYLGSSELKSLRASFLRGERPQSCSECWITEDAGLRSIRQLDLNHSLKLHRFSVSLSNKCNFKCVMCNPEDSSAWSKDKEACALRNLDPYFTVTDFTLIDFIIEKAKTQKIIFSVMGGEPLICDEYIYFLQQVEKFNLYNNINLVITTNLSVLSYKNIDHLEHFSRFKDIELYASFDGTGMVGEYIRYGFSHKKFEENLIKAKEFVKYFSTTIQIYNIFELPNIFRYANSFNIPVVFCFLTNPDFLSLEVLEDGEKENLIQYYNEQDFYNEEIFNLLNTITYNKRKLKFKQYTKDLDTLWNRDILNFIPELRTIL